MTYGTMTEPNSRKPTPTALAELRHGFLAPGKGHPVFLERRSLTSTLETLARHVQHGTILDVGCGVKPYEPLLAAPGDRWVGLDHPATLQGSYAERTMADLLADCRHVPFPDARFDTVICTQMLEHVPDPANVLVELARVLRPDGVLLLTAPMVWPLHEEPFDFFRYTQHGLRALLQRAGFEVAQEVQRGGGASALGQAFLDLHFARRRPSFHSKLYRQLLCRLVNQLCPWLDRVAPARRLALGWAIAARKPPSPAAFSPTAHAQQ